MERKTRNNETDVPVPGSSAVGYGTAITAASAGVKVFLVDKGHLESSGCLGGGNDHFLAVLDEGEHDGYEDLCNSYPTPISGFSKGVVHNYYRAIRQGMKAFEEAGVELMHNPAGTYMRSVGFG